MSTTTVQVRMDAALKQQVEIKLKSMGLNMSTMVNILAHQIVRQNRIPFDIIAADDTETNLDNLPPSVNADKMTDEELQQHLLIGYQEAIDDADQTAALEAMKANGVAVTEMEDIDAWKAACAGMTEEYLSRGDNWQAFYDVLTSVE